LIRWGTLLFLSNHLLSRITQILNVNLNVELFAILLDTSTGCPDNPCDELLRDLELNHVAAVDGIVRRFLDNPQDVLGGTVYVGWRATNDNNVLVTVASNVDSKRTPFTNKSMDCEEWTRLLKEIRTH
jgi:hypothetical protein